MSCADIIDQDDLASYPGVTLAAGGNYALLLELANGEVLDIIGQLNLTEYPSWVKSLTLKIAARALTNPQGYTSVTKQIDDWKKTTRYEGEATEAGIYLTDAERARLLGLLGGGRVGTIKVRVPGNGYDFR